MNAAILASGPSMTAEQAESVRGLTTFAINTTYRLAPWANYLYACDGTWWDHHINDVRKVFHGEQWTQEKLAADKYGLKHIASKKGVGLCRQPGLIYQGGGATGPGNSGYQAINLAYHFGAKRIILLGFDMKAGQKTHWHERHVVHRDSPYLTWVIHFRDLAKDLQREGVEVLNATPDSALDCFPKVTIDEALDACALHAA